MNNHGEILFRGFHPCEDGDTIIYVEGEAVKGRWVEGSLLVYPDGDSFICYDDCVPDTLHKREVIPSTVGQYTTKDDTHKHKVFVSDVVCYNGKNHTVYGIIRFGRIPDFGGRVKNVGYFIEWQNDGANMWGDWWRCDLDFWLEDENCKVIGTIWDKENENGMD